MAEILIKSGSLGDRDVKHIKALHALLGQSSGRFIKVVLKTKNKFRRKTVVEVSFSPKEKLHDTVFFCEQMRQYLEALTNFREVEIKVSDR